MKKTLTAMAVAAVLAAPMAASADATVYGKVNAAVSQKTMFGADAAWSSDISSSKGTNVGVKGSNETELLDFSAVYKFEMGMNADNTYAQRDTWVGLSSNSLGTVRVGAMKTSYKTSGAYLDIFWDTEVQAANDLRIMSNQLHGGTGDGRGRQTNTIQYTSPTVAGATLNVDYNMIAAGSDNLGVGVHFKNGPVLAFVDYVSLPGKGKDGSDLTATKVGGKFTAGDVAVGVQYEIDGGAINKDATSKAKSNTLFTNVSYTMGATTLTASYGMQDENASGAKDGHTAYVVGAMHSIAKTTALYAAYGSATGDDLWGDGMKKKAIADDTSTILTFGMQQSF
ncbi:MAG: porin [Gammaproteobacteria bacterium]|nr:porin [Gammaproteobacteria bacterium]